MAEPDLVGGHARQEAGEVGVARCTVVLRHRRRHGRVPARVSLPRHRRAIGPRATIEGVVAAPPVSVLAALLPVKTLSSVLPVP
ncbi:MAG: hypothetical protein IPJ52_00880 [Rhodocyclaceae bacterium]|nr:hypothetical protein [Rhodocyclaceae bacterium]